ncbi:ATP-dependent RNA helicase [Planktothrix serta PCC 8927]|uniref:RNA helicase n=1 Tax=Planktothrix serta PCC 8927 TaxID=671068 RepID=A0A7Z9BN19_9CYAN|nr:DEAD/DEAH box helicase [Planktothrix serta]VXD18251.1 ATP-dependent RNA helicase [Planktothrix serta PCC 8927]
MSPSFASLGISEERASYLETIGFSEPTAIQVEAIPHILAGRDVVGLAQTGTGKTAAFSLPILEQLDTSAKGVQALILTPTRELAMQVKEAIRKMTDDRSLYVLTVYGGQSIDRQIQRLQQGVQIVVGTPGRILDLLNRGNLKFDRIKWLVLDEADEMLSMGFIQDVEKILESVAEDRQTAFFSATMEPSIWKLVKKFLKNPVTIKAENPKATPKRIEQRAYMAPRGWTKARALQPILELEDPESAIIFVRTKQAAAELTTFLQGAGHSVDEYHGNLNQTQRERLLQRFRRRQVRWIVATDIAARGLDVDHLTHVINYDLPDNAESYVHRIGRTGRAGRDGIAITLIQPIDRRKLRIIERHLRHNFTVLSIPKRSQIEARYIDRLQGRVREALAGERVASFLPIVAQLGEEYDPHAIAAAALQLAYDQTRPSWLDSDFDDQEEETQMSSSSSSSPKPKLNRRISRPSVTQGVE